MGATVNLDSQYASRIGVADESSFYAENGSVTEWNLTDEFIYCVSVHYADPCNKNTNSFQLKLQYSEDGGAWTDVASGNAMQPGTGTTLVQGNNVTQRITTNTPIAFCTSGFATSPLEVEGNTNSNSTTVAGQTWTEVHFAVDPSNAKRGSTYQFRVYQVTTGTALIGNTPCASQVTTAAGQTQSLSDTLTVSDNFTSVVNRKLSTSDSLVVDDALTTLAHLFVSQSDAITLSDAQILGIKLALSDALSLSEQNDYDVTRKLTVSESLTLGEFLNPQTAYDKINATEEDLTDWVEEDGNFFTQEVNPESLSVSDTLTFAENYNLSSGGSVSDDLVFTDEFTLEVKVVIDVSDALTFVDQVILSLAAEETPSDLLTFGELLTLQAALKSAQTDTVTLQELLTLIRHAYEEASESVTLNDQFGLKASLSLSLSDDLTLGETQNLHKSAKSYVNEPLSLAEDLTPIAHLNSSQSDSLSLSENMDPLLRANTALTDTLTITDEYEAIAHLSLTINEDPGLTDLFRYGSFLLVDDSLSLTEDRSLVQHFVYSLQETVTLSDNVFPVQHFLHAYADTVTFDTAVFTRTGLKKTDTLTLTDEFTLVSAAGLAIFDTLVFSDSIASQKTEETGVVFGLTDTFSLLTARKLYLEDALGLVESYNPIGHYSIVLGNHDATEEDSTNWSEENGANFTQEGDKDLAFYDYISTGLVYYEATDDLRLVDNFYSQVFIMPCPPATGPCSTPVTDLPSDNKSLDIISPALGGVNIQFIPFYIYIVWTVSTSYPDQYVRLFYRKSGSSERYSTVLVDRDSGAIMTPPTLESGVTYEVLMRLETDTTYSDWVVQGIVSPPLESALSFSDEFVLS